MQIDGIEPLIPPNQMSNNDINVRGTRRLLFIFLLGATAGFIFSAIFLLGINLNPHEDDFSLDDEDSDEAFISDQAYQPIEQSRIMCLIVMRPEDSKISTEFVERTWGRRCNQLIFTSNVDMHKNNTLLMPYEKEYNTLWNNTLIALGNLFAIRRNQFEWVFKTSMESFAIIENLHFMVKPYSPLDPIYFGVRFGSKKPKGQKSSSYLFSKQALYQFYEESLMYDSKCRLKIPINDDEDLEFEKCMRISHVKAMDSRDNQGRHRFMAYLTAMPPIYYDKKTYMNHTNYEEHYLTYSDYPVCFHFVPFEEMYQLEYMLYQLRPFGLLNHQQLIYDNSTTTSKLAEKRVTPKAETLKSFL